MHDITYDQSFRANKSVFVFEDFLLCLGSDIQTKDKRYPTVTTLFQSFSRNTSEERMPEGYILTDPSLMYAVKGGAVRTSSEGSHTRAYIEHGTAPEAAKYHYYILKTRKSIGPSTIIQRESDKSNSTG